MNLKKIFPDDLSSIEIAVKAINLIHDPNDPSIWTSSNVLAGLQERKQDFFLFVENDLPVGTVAIQINKDQIADLFNFAILESFQGKGFGKAGLKLILKYVFQNFPEMSEIRCVVFKENFKAFHLYQSLGFEVSEDRGDSFLLKYKKMALCIPRNGQSRARCFFSNIFSARRQTLPD